MEELDNLFDDIRKWNRQWIIYQTYYDHDKKSDDENKINISKKPKSADIFILELNKKYLVTLK